MKGTAAVKKAPEKPVAGGGGRFVLPSLLNDDGSGLALVCWRFTGERGIHRTKPLKRDVALRMAEMGGREEGVRYWVENCNEAQ